MRYSLNLNDEMLIFNSVIRTLEIVYNHLSDFSGFGKLLIHNPFDVSLTFYLHHSYFVFVDL